MGSSLQIARIMGIPVKLHWTCALLLPLGAYLIGEEALGWDGVFFFMLIFILVSLCVVLHELGHALVARYYGIATDDIVLSPLFGVARIRKLPNTPLGEFMVAVAGPLVNVVLGLFFLLFLQAYHPVFLEGFVWELYGVLLHGTNRVVTLPVAFTYSNMALGILVLVNLGLVVFNLIPAFPMDGGRMFRAVLHHFTDKENATRIATWLGKGLAVLMIVIAMVYAQYAMVLVGMFIFYMANAEYETVQREVFLGRFLVGDAMRRFFTPLDKFTTQSHLRSLFLNGYEKYYLVFDGDGNLEGLLLREDIIRWLAAPDERLSHGFTAYLTNDFPILEIGMPLSVAMETMQETHLYFLPVQDETGKVVGVIDTKGIHEFLDISRKLDAHH